MKQQKCRAEDTVRPGQNGEREDGINIKRGRATVEGKGQVLLRSSPWAQQSVPLPLVLGEQESRLTERRLAGARGWGREGEGRCKATGG